LLCEFGVEQQAPLSELLQRRWLRAATRPPATTVVVQAPAVGTVIPTLPGGCATVGAGGAVIYQCSNVYYRPYYQGTQLVYQVVTYP